MTQYPKRLIEVDLPIKRISAHARREKSIRHGHISTLHIWWARRPLAACRAVICASLWPDPVDELCPDSFRISVRKEMLDWATNNLALLSEESYHRFILYQQTPDKLNDNLELRNALLDFIADFSNWDNSTKKEYLETSRLLTQIAHEGLGGTTGTKPLVVDPFAGGGSIPLEALRVGADAFASDLNPVAVLLNKVVLEYIPKYGQKLADEVRKWGEWIKKEAEKELAQFYPKDPDGSTPIAYLWARTIKCEGPGCGVEVPLMRTMWLSKKGKKSIALRIIPNQKLKKIEFEIIYNAKSEEVMDGTIKRGTATCPCCKYTTTNQSIKKQLLERNGGTSDARLIAIRQNNKQTGERTYRLPNSIDLKVIETIRNRNDYLKSNFTSTTIIPNEPTPTNKSHRAVGSIFIYGMTKWSDIFTPRQLASLVCFLRLIQNFPKLISEDNSNDFIKAIQTCLAMALDRLADFNSSLCVLNVTGGRGVKNTFTRQALPMVWDFMETNPFNNVGANWIGSVNTFIDTITTESVIKNTGTSKMTTALSHPLPDDSVQCFFTDPPYYDSIPYAEIADFFYVWLKRSISELHKELFVTELTKKNEQVIVWHPNSASEKIEYEKKMSQALREGCRILNQNGIGVVVFAHKSTKGWESQLYAIIQAGWAITASWPIDTERGGRLNAQNTASLASSIHLICRPRQTDEIGDWRDVLTELPKRIHEWMPRLSEEGIVGADAIFACLGPALEIFSRYSKVEKASGEIVTLKEYLEKVWAAVAKEALTMIFTGADATGFEEDSRLTAIWLWTLKTADTNGKQKSQADDGKKGKTSGFSLEYDAARKIAQGLGAYLENLKHLVLTKGDTAILLPVAARTKYLFGKDTESPKSIKTKKREPTLFDFDESFIEKESESWKGDIQGEAGKTVLDQLHQCMLLFAANRSDALKRFLTGEGIGNNPLFWRLAQSLSALYPAGTDEKRWVDGLLAKKKGFGF